MSSQIAGLAGTSSSSSTSSSTSSTQGSDALGKNDFLKLLITQLQNQDPTSPADTSQFASQLAQFSSLEQMQNINTTLQSLVTTQGSANQLSTANLVGKEALCTTKQLQLAANGTVDLVANLSAASASTTLVVTDASGTQVAKVDFGAQAAGQNTLTWNGLGNNGSHVAAGTYTLTLTATDSSGNNVSLDQTIRRKVDGVSLQGTTPVLVMGSDQVPVSSVEEIVSP